MKKVLFLLFIFSIPMFGINKNILKLLLRANSTGLKNIKFAVKSFYNQSKKQQSMTTAQARFIKMSLGAVAIQKISDNEILIKLPDAQTLDQRFREAGFDKFVANTDIIYQLADRKTNSYSLILTVELALDDYAEHVRNPILAKKMQMRIGQIFDVILEDNPEVLREVKKQFVEISRSMKKIN